MVYVKLEELAGKAALASDSFASHLILRPGVYPRPIIYCFVGHLSC